MLQCVCATKKRDYATKRRSNRKVFTRHLATSVGNIHHPLTHTGFRPPLRNHSLTLFRFCFNNVLVFLRIKTEVGRVVLCVCGGEVFIFLGIPRCVSGGNFCRPCTPFLMPLARRSSQAHPRGYVFCSPWGGRYFAQEGQGRMFHGKQFILHKVRCKKSEWA